MSKQENEEDNVELSVTYVYLPEEQIYGVIKTHGAYASIIEYYDMGIGYLLEVSNDEFIEVDEINIGYIIEGENK
jgi:hypothetical protein